MAVAQVMSHSTAQVRTGQVLAPAITVQHLAIDATATYFATPVLLSATGAVVEALQGTKAATGMQINGGAAIEYTFTDLAISAPGTYYIRLDLYMVSATEGATLVAQTNLNPITVSN
ncbi:hypothetical protein GGI35DRAFT_462519 [Trichoderma velutinum]